MSRAVAYRRDPEEEYRASTLELFYDLVFVFAITQVSHFLLENITWLGVLQSTIILLVVWWAWQYTAWATNEFDTNTIPIRLLLIVIMMASLLMSVAIPEAFGDKALLFVLAYVFIQVGRHSFMAFAAAEKGSTERQRALHIISWFCFAGIFWIAGALVEGDARIYIWLVALAIDYGAPMITYPVPWLEKVGMEAWSLGGTHFAERFQLFTIIALGETIVLTGATTSGLETIDFPVIAAFSAAFFSTVCLWWLYFNYVSTVFERVLIESNNRTITARNLYTFGHIPIIAGIILCAVGDELIIAHPTEYLKTPYLLAVIAGPVLYLLSYVPSRILMTGGLPVKRVSGATACVTIGIIASITHPPALTVGLLVVAVLIAVVVWETLTPSPSHREPETGEASVVG